MYVIAYLSFSLLLASFPIASPSFLPDGLNCWFWQGSIVVNNWLYIDSGEIWSESSGGHEWMNFTLSIDLSTSWTTSNVDPKITLHTTGNNMLTRRPTLFYDSISDTIFWFGGWPYYYDIQPAVWGFTPNTQGGVSWTLSDAAGIGQAAKISNTFSGFTCPSGALYASSPTTYYSLGGAMYGTTDPALVNLGSSPAMSGLVEYKFQEGAWSNASSSGYQQDGFGVGGEALYVPIFGANGILIFLGGDAPTNQNYVQGSSLVSMADITIYDIQSGKFYQQTTGGPKTPISRTAFCAVGVGSSNASTWEIFVFGGYQGVTPSPDQAEDLGAVYILTLPAFEWIQAAGNVTQRASHTCQIVGNRQMLSIGGNIENNFTTTDPWTNGMGLFDLTDLTWSFDYNANGAAYVPSQLVTNFYSTSSNRYPASWSNPALKAIFNDTASASATSSSSGSSPTNSGPTEPATTQHSNTGAIVGGVVGGIAGLVLLGVFLWLLRKYIRRRSGAVYELAHRPHEVKSSAPPGGGVSELDSERRPAELSGNSSKPTKWWNRYKPNNNIQTQPTELEA